MNSRIKYLKEKFKHISKIPLISTQRADVFCSICIDAKGFTFGCLRKNNNKMELDLLEYIQCKPNNFLMELWGFVKKHGLESADCVWVLTPGQYQLIMHNELPVKEEEFQSAIRWQIRKLLSYPVDEAYIDSFPIPSAQVTNPKKTIMVTVAQQTQIKPIALEIAESGLNLVAIDIQELAFRNITALFENDDMTTALLYLQEKSSELIITRQKKYFFSRHLEWNYEALTNTPPTDENINPYLDKLSLEIQRSFDYFQSQWRLPVPSRVLIVTGYTDQDISSYLSQRLRITTVNLNLNNILPSHFKITFAQEYQFLPVIGGLLRNEVVNATTS